MLFRSFSVFSSSSTPTSNSVTNFFILLSIFHPPIQREAKTEKGRRMDPEQRRKRKRVVAARHLHISSRSLFLCFSFLIFLLFLSSHHHFFFFTPSTFRPSLTASTLSLLYSSASNSILDPLIPTTPSYTLHFQNLISLSTPTIYATPLFLFVLFRKVAQL